MSNTASAQASPPPFHPTYDLLPLSHRKRHHVRAVIGLWTSVSGALFVLLVTIMLYRLISEREAIQHQDSLTALAEPVRTLEQQALDLEATNRSLAQANNIVRTAKPQNILAGMIDQVAVSTASMQKDFEIECVKLRLPLEYPGVETAEPEPDGAGGLFVLEGRARISDVGDDLVDALDRYEWMTKVKSESSGNNEDFNQPLRVIATPLVPWRLP